MRNLLPSEVILPQLPSRMVLSMGVILIVLAPLVAIGVDQPWEARLLASGLVLLFGGVEFIEHRFYHDQVPPRMGLLFLILRLVLAELVSQVAGDSPLNMLLFVLAVFDSYFVFGAQISTLLAVAFVLISVTRANEMSVMFDESSPIAGWLVLNLALVLLLIFARALQRDKEHQRYTEQLLADLQTSHRELQAYAAQIAELATVEERNRLARDIHDSLGHYLMGVNIQLERAQVFHTRDPQQSLLAIQEAKQAAEDALRDVRRSVAGLRETDTTFSLQHSLTDLLNNLASNELQIDFQFSGNEDGYSRMTLLTLYRAVQEGLTNIQKHANATLVKLEVELSVQQACLCLSDNGRGFETSLQQPTITNGVGYGLQGIRERIGLVRGQMTLTSTPQQGTTLLITVPKNPLILTGKSG
jgi:signal transduction histidine kinase